MATELISNVNFKKEVLILAMKIKPHGAKGSEVRT